MMKPSALWSHPRRTALSRGDSSRIRSSFHDWGSRKFRRLHPELFERIQSAQHHPFSHDDLPHLLLGLAGIKTSHYKAHRDPLSSQFRPQRRLLRGKINYDEVMRSSRP